MNEVPGTPEQFDLDKVRFEEILKGPIDEDLSLESQKKAPMLIRL